MNKSNNSQQPYTANFTSATTEVSICGYDIDRIEGINPRFLCPFCKRIIREPIQSQECGHRYCRGCFKSRVDAASEGKIKCPDAECSDMVGKDEIMIDKAFKRELDNLQVGCLHRNTNECNWIGLLKDYQSHLDEKHNHYNCRYCKNVLPSRAALDEHYKICPEIFEKCRLGSACTDEMYPKTDILHHLRSEKHQETINKILKGEIPIPDTFNYQQENEYIKRLEEESSKRLHDLTEALDKVKSSSIELNNSFGQIHQRVTTAIQDLNTMHATVNERLAIKQSIQPTQEKIQKDIEQLHELCNQTEHISIDGTLTWRIDNISEKMSDAQSERQTSIYSPIFYSSPTGYKMRARLFLFGDGNARRTHISLFFLLMKGEYDSILKWPFHYKVTFCLLDQTGSNRHIIDSFYPDVKSNSFQRPKDAANIASGIPKFFPLPMLLQDDNAYVRENTLYIKIIIALNDTPKAMLPFMLTLNPALPNYVQETLISQEAAKQQANVATTAS